MRSLILKQIEVLSRSMSAMATSVFRDPDVAKTLSTIHDRYVVVPADKAQNISHPMFITKFETFWLSNNFKSRNYITFYGKSKIPFFAILDNFMKIAKFHQKY